MLKKVMTTLAYVVVVLLILGLGTVGTAWLMWGHLTSPVRLQRQVKGELKKVFTGEVNVRWAELSPALRLDVEGIKIFAPKDDQQVADSGKPVISAPKAHVRFDPERFLHGEQVPRRVELSYPSVRVVHDTQTGDWNISGLLDIPGKRPEGKKEIPRALLKEGLYLESGKVSIKSQEIFKSRDPRVIEGINLRIFHRSPGSPLWDMRGNISRGLLQGMLLSGRFGEDGLWLDCSIADLSLDQKFLKRIPVGDDLEELFHPRGRIKGTASFHMPADAQSGDALKYNAKIDLRGLSSRTKFYGARMHDMAGQVLIVGGRVIFRDISGRLRADELGLQPGACQPAKVRVNGEYDIISENAWVRILAQDFPLTKKSVQEIPEVGQVLWKELRPSGFANVDIKVEDGPDMETRFGVRADLQKVGLEVEKLPFEPEGLEGEVDVTEERVRLRDVRGIIKQSNGTARIGLNGVFGTEGHPRDLTVQVSNLRLEKHLVRAIPDLGHDLWDIFEPEGMLSGSVTIKRQGGKPQLAGSLHLAGATLRPEFMPIAVKEVTADINFDENGIQISQLVGHMNVNSEEGNENIAEHVEISGRLAGDGRSGKLFINIPLCGLNKSMVSAIPDVGDTLWEKLRPEGLVALNGRVSYDLDSEDKVKYLLRIDMKNAKATWAKLKATMSSLHGTVVLSEQDVIIPHLNGVIASGPFDASGFVARSSEGTVRYNGSLEFRRLDLQRFLYEVTGEEKNVRGRISGLVEMDGKLGETEQLEGSGTVDLSNGKIWRTPVFMGLVDVLHLSSPGQHGRFDQGKMRFTFDNKKLDVDLLRVTSPSAELTGRGEVMFDGGRLDLQMVAATLPKGGLPIIGQALRAIMRPVERQLVRVHVTGTLADPQYSPKPLENITRPITSVFDLLTSPFRSDEEEK